MIAQAAPQGNAQLGGGRAGQVAHAIPDANVGSFLTRRAGSGTVRCPTTMPMHARPVRSPLTLPALATFALTTLLGAQTPMRDGGFGRVTDADGEPWAEAEVHLLYRPHQLVADPAFGEHLVLASDERGQFRADLLVGVAYDAWAVGPVEADGSYRISGLRRDAVARSPILLAGTRRQFVRRVRPQLHASWNGHERLRWRAASFGSRRINLAQWLQPDDDGVLTLPRWPSTSVGIEAWTDDWQAWSVYFPVTADMAIRYGVQFRGDGEKPTAENVQERMAAVHEVTVPPRRTRVITLRDGADGPPVADAVVRAEHMPADLTPQRSDADGAVRAVFAHDEEAPINVPFRWVVQPRAHAENSLSPSSYRSGDPPVTSRELAAGRTIATTVLCGGEPSPALPVLLFGSIGTGPSSAWFGVDPRVLTTDAQGRLDVPGRCERFPFRLTAVLSPTLRARLRGRHDAPVAPLAVLRWESTQLPENVPPIDLAQLVPIDVQVQRPDGTPPGSTPVVLALVGCGGDAPSEPVTVYTDHRGRVRVLAEHRQDVLAHVVTSQGAAWRRLDADEGEVELRIDPRHVARIRVVDQNGAPCAGVSVDLVSPDGFGDVDRDVLTAIRDMCSVHAIGHDACVTGEDGVGTIVSPLLGVSLDLAIDIEGQDDSQRVHVPFAGADDDAPLDVRIQR